MRALAGVSARSGDPEKSLDGQIEALVQKYGIDEIIAALARYCHATGRAVLFRRLNKIYEWIKS